MHILKRDTHSEDAAKKNEEGHRTVSILVLTGGCVYAVLSYPALHEGPLRVRRNMLFSGNKKRTGYLSNAHVRQQEQERVSPHPHLHWKAFLAFVSRRAFAPLHVHLFLSSPRRKTESARRTFCCGRSRIGFWPLWKRPFVFCLAKKEQKKGKMLSGQCVGFFLGLYKATWH